MMNSLYTAANSLFFKIFLGIIITSFILSNISGYLTNKDINYVVKVNDQKISFNQFETAIYVEHNRLRQQLSDKYEDFVSKEQFLKNLRQEVLNHLINEALINQYTQKLGLSVSDEQVKEAIFSTFLFQSDGKFDNSRYNSFIKKMGISVEQYIQTLRNQLKNRQLINAIINSDFILKSESDKLVELITQQRIVREAIINVQEIADKQQVNDVEISSFYKQNENIFVFPEQFRVSYIKLDAESIQANVSNDDIQSYYDQHQEQFIQPKLNRYSVIQTKTKFNAQSILDELNKGSNFAEIAKKKSEDIISSKNGGDIGWLEDLFTPDELRNAGLTMKGQLSGIIKSSVGYLIVRLDDFKPAKVKPLTDVRDKIIKEVKKKKSMDIYYIMKEKISDAVRNNESLDRTEKILGIKSIKTDWFSRYNLPEELNFKQIADIIFNNNSVIENNIIDNNSNVVTVNENCTFMLRIIDHKQETIQPLEEVKNQIITKIKYSKAIQQAKLSAKKTLISLSEGKGNNIKNIVNLSFSMPKTMLRNEDDPISQVAFSLELPKKDKPSYGIANDMKGNIIILALDEVKSGEIPEEQKRMIIKDISEKNAQISLEALINNLRKKAKIRINDSFE